MSKISERRDLGCRIQPATAPGFRHRFGGGLEYQGTVPKAQEHRIQLIFKLDLSDPAIPITVDGLLYLPLFFSFQYDARPVAYKVLSDSQIEILGVEGAEYTPHFPYLGYPAAFDVAPVELVPIAYEEQRALLIHDLAADRILSLGPEGAEDNTIVKRIGFEFSRIGVVHKFLQKLESKGCPNRDCEFHRCQDQAVMRPFATVWNEPIPGVDLWRADGEQVVIVFQICAFCGTIRAFNQCG